MPTLPSPRLAGAAERWFGRPGTVVSLDEPAPGLRRVGFEVPALRDKPWTRGQEIEFRVSERGFRHYTMCAVDPGSGLLEVLFALAADGPGTRWARGLALGDPVAVMGPGGGVRRQAGERELFLGDSTALGLFHALAPTAAEATGAVEVPADTVPAARALLPGLDVLTEGAEPGEALLGWLGALDAPPPRACLAGHAGTLQDLRRLLRERGLGRSAIATKAYWATGRAGL